MALRTTILSDTFLVLCNVYFIFNGYLDYRYCNAPLSRDNIFGTLVLDFCEKHHPPVCDRPEWMRIMCCFDGYFFIHLYFLMIYIIITDSWFKYKSLILFNLGAYYFSQIFYYIMLHSYPKSPSYALEWYASEMPYNLALVLVLYKTITAKVPLVIKNSPIEKDEYIFSNIRPPTSPPRNYKKD